MTIVYLLFAIFAFLIGAYSVVVLIDVSRQQPTTKLESDEEGERMLRHTVVLLICALVFGLALEGLLP